MDQLSDPNFPLHMGEAESASDARKEDGLDTSPWTSVPPEEDGSPAQWGPYYVANGLHLVPCAPCAQPCGDSWQESIISSPHRAGVHWMRRSHDNMGLHLGASSIASLRIGRIAAASAAFAQAGVDLGSLLASDSQPMITGDAETFQLLFRVPEGTVPPARMLTRPSENAADDREIVLEFRGGPMCILLPPSVHPELHTPFVWLNGPGVGEGIPPLPVELLSLWQTWDALGPSPAAPQEESQGPNVRGGNVGAEGEQEEPTSEARFVLGDSGGGERTAQVRPKKISQRKLKANRDSSKRSTGPKTASGKKAASRNAVTHGLTAANGLLPDDDPQEHAEFFESVHAQCRSEDHLHFIVECIAWELWRLRRIPGIEAGLLTWHCLQQQLDRLTAATETYSSDTSKRSAGDETHQKAQRKKAELQARQRVDVELAAQGFLADAMGPNALSNLSRYQTGIVNNLVKFVGLLGER